MANEKALPSHATLINGQDHDANLIRANDEYLRDTIYVDNSEPLGPHVHRGMIWIDTSVNPHAIKIRLTGSWATVTTVEKLLFGIDANKGATPDPGDFYVATDTNKLYACFTDDIWQQVYPPDKIFSGVDASKSATPDPGNIYIATDTGKIYNCFVNNIWVQVHPNENVYENLLGNGGFEIWQRGAGPWTIHGNYTADLWRMEKDGASTMTVSRDATEAHFGYYSLKAIFTLGGGTYGQLESEQALNWTGQSTWVTKITGQKFSLSAWVKCSTAAAVKIRIKYSGATPFEDSAYHTGSGNWEKLTVTGTYPSTGGMLGVSLWFDASATAWFDEVMLVVGSAAVDYLPLHIAEQQDRCQRWYWITNRWVAQFYAPAALAGHMWWYPFTTTMKATPTITMPGGATTNYSAGGVIDINTKSWNFWLRGINIGITTFVMDAGNPGNVIMEVT